VVSRLPPPISARFGLAFAWAPPQSGLTLLVTVSRRIIMQNARHHPALRRRALTACRRMVSGSLSSPLGVLLIFRSRYWFAIGRQRVLSLAGWAPRIQARFRVTGPTQVPDGPLRLSPTGLSPPAVEHSRTARLGSRALVSGPTTPPGRVPVVWAGPLSLAATHGVEVSFLSSGY
jgi:hypothetical protein